MSGYSLTLYVLRDVPSGQRMRQFVSERGLEQYVEFAGYAERETYLDYLYSCDLFCLPSYSESIPISALEALSLGKPIVATDVGGTSEVVTHEENGYLCQTSGQSFTDGIACFIDNPDRLRRISEANLEAAEAFSWETVIEQYEQSLLELMREQT